MSKMTRKRLKGIQNLPQPVLRTSSNHYKDRDNFRDLQLKELKSDLDEGLADLRRGRVVKMDAKTIKAEGRRRRTTNK